MRSVFAAAYFCLYLVLLNACARPSVDSIQPQPQPLPPATDSSHVVSNIRINPDNGSYGDTLVVYATNITYTDSVLINGMRGRIVDHQGDSTKVIVPLGAGTGLVTISYGSGLGICQGPVFKYNYTPYVITIGGTGVKGSDDADGIAIDATIDGPFGVAVDDAGNVFVSEVGHPKIRKITPGGLISTFAGTGAPGMADGPGSTAQFYNPFSIVLDKSGNAYIADLYNIRKITTSGVVSTLAGNGTGGYADGTGNLASFNHLYGMTIDPQGNIFVADNYNKVIRKITPAGIASTVVTGPFHQYQNGKDTVINGFIDPWGVASDGNGNLYVTDYSYVRKIASNGSVTTLAGDGIGGDRDGLGQNAELWGPIGIVCDPNGNLFIADFAASKIKMITPAGMVSTIAGATYNGANFQDGPALKARFYSPVNLALDKKGNIYVGDENNFRVREIIFQ